MEATTPTTITSLNGGEVGKIVTLHENDADVHAIMAQALPKYLHLGTENPAVADALRFDGDYSYDLDTRFEVVPATKGTGLVHIRSLQNYKYWVNLDETKNNFVTATAVKPEENQTDKQCTLFQPVFLKEDSNRVLRLRHVSTGAYVAFFLGTGNSYGLLCLSHYHDDAGKYNVCTSLDWDSIVVLPDLVRIKGVKSGNHLKAFEDGYILWTTITKLIIPHCLTSKCLQVAADDWVLLMQDPSTDFHDLRTVFFPTILGGNRIIIRSLQSNCYCNMHSADNKENCLATLNTYPDDWSYMEIEEPVISRKIENVRYHLNDARIYDEKTIALVSDESSNKTPNSLTSELNLKTTVSNTTNWSTNVSMTVGVKMSEIEISGDVTKSSEWGETETKSVEVGYVKTVNVPSMTRIKATLMATRISYGIPFSYTQHDLLENGSTRVTDKNDGFFTVHNGYGYTYEVVQLSLK
ncbi:hypothetical protein MKW98_006160 [Papaver atlanticum]|uniref:Agglutinin domain-containing protein n=1 Tax=Papaver atlanticum TaxID=357466 RepID=A0AAD4TGY7_9MAGN|nr:hypothetical protein MKW98_006160 [Papaver atlanticum]